MNKILIIILAATLVFTGCSLGDFYTISDKNIKEEYVTEKEDVLKYALWSAPTGNFTPPFVTSDYDGVVANLAHEPLVSINPYEIYEGMLAKAWEISHDYKTIVFHLREGVTWHDGELFTAKDVKFTYEFIADPAYTGEKFYALSAIKGIQDYKDGNATEISGINVIDEYTISISTSEVYAPFLEHIGGIRIIPEHVWKEVDIASAPQNTEMLRNTIGTGPYSVETFISDQYVQMESFDDYWGGAPNIEKLIFQVVNQEIAQVQMFNGEIGFMPISSMNPDDLRLYEDAGLEIQEVLYTSFQQMGINCADELLNNKYVRQAFACAIDRQNIVETLLFGHANVANTAYPAFYWSYPGDDAIDEYIYDPERAISILTEKAGWEYNEGIMYANKLPVELTLIYPSGNKARELSAPVIQENLGNIGIDVKLEIMEFSTMISRLKDGEFDMFLLGSGIGSDPDVTNLFSTSSIGNGNYYRYSNTKLDELLLKGVHYISQEDRMPIYNQIGEILNDELPTIFLYNWSEGRVISKNLKGVNCFAFSNFYKVQNWYIEE